MFSKLHAVLKAGVKLAISVTGNETSVTVTIIPSGENEKSVFNKPLSVCGNPAEIDEKLPDLVLSAFAQSGKTVGGLTTNLSEIEPPANEKPSDKTTTDTTADSSAAATPKKGKQGRKPDTAKEAATSAATDTTPSVSDFKPNAQQKQIIEKAKELPKRLKVESDPDMIEFLINNITKELDAKGVPAEYKDELLKDIKSAIPDNLKGQLSAEEEKPSAGASDTEEDLQDDIVDEQQDTSDLRGAIDNDPEDFDEKPQSAAAIDPNEIF